jgi:hypothetical protein
MGEFCNRVLASAPWLEDRQDLLLPVGRLEERRFLKHGPHECDFAVFRKPNIVCIVKENIVRG